jgi:glycogen debranching enzyme
MVSQIDKNKDLHRYSYFLTNPNCFFHRYCDTGFKTKWTGFWAKNKKFLEFFAFKIGDEYLSEHNCFKIYYDFVKAEHFHRLGNSTFVQSVWLPRENACMVIELRSSSKQQISAELELAINTRLREENWHDRGYWIEQCAEQAFAIGSDLGKLYIMPLKGHFQLEKRPSYHEHYPGGEKQRYFKPGVIKLSGTEIKLALSLDKNIDIASNEQELKRNYYEELTNVIECDDPLIEDIYKKALLNLEMLYCGKGYYAGLPWFLQLWARDLFWSVPALLYAGFPERVKHILELFSNNIQDGRVPNFIYGEKKVYNAIDSNPLFITALYDYIAFSADIEFLEKHIGNAYEAMSYLISRCGTNNLVKHDIENNETWMDTINRREHAIEVQALFINALERFAELVFLTKKPNNDMLALAFESQSIAKKLRARFENLFYDKKTCNFADRLLNNEKDLSKRPNALVPIMFGITHKGIEQYEHEDVLTKKGLASLSMLDEKYRADAYHNGQIWSLCTGWLACAEFACNRPEKGYEILKLLRNDFDSNALGCIGESWNSKTFEPMGCGLQLWGATFIIRAVDEFMLGIKPWAPKKEIRVKPILPKSVSHIRRHLRIVGKDVVVTAQKTHNSVQVHCKIGKV